MGCDKTMSIQNNIVHYKTDPGPLPSFAAHGQPRGGGGQDRRRHGHQDRGDEPHDLDEQGRPDRGDPDAGVRHQAPAAPELYRFHQEVRRRKRTNLNLFKK